MNSGSTIVGVADVARMHRLSMLQDCGLCKTGGECAY